MNNKYKLLKNTFGHESFRDFQEEIVDTILAKQDVLTILPTGGGKSLCYQLPTLLMGGVTVVVSPLIALMQDQIKALQDINISAKMISSSQSVNENSITLQQLLNGELKFIYVAPERFTSNEFVAVLQRVNINYFVIDEAHCVSAWGHEFRAEYRNLDKLKRFFPNCSIAAFTATATKKVEADIALSLQLDQAKHFRAKTIRNNLEISVKPRISNGKAQVLEFLEAHKGLCGIIYTFTRKEAENLAEFLSENGYVSKAYHAGLTPSVKDEVYEDFVYEKIDIVVATIAFGMGIDKSNIRFVIHTSLPKTLENYYQEIGRAGRDGDMSYVYLLYSKSDEIKRKMQIEDAINSSYKQTGLDKLEAMYRYCISTECRHKIIANYFEDEINPCKSFCDNCTRGEVELVDISVDAQKFLSAVYRSEQRFGVNHIIDILRASKNQKLLEFNHDKLSVYGLGVQRSKDEWVAIANELIDFKAVVLGEFRALKLSHLGMEILKSKEKFFIAKDRLEASQKSKERQIIVDELSLNEAIYERFKALRKKIALEYEVPAYVIFGDKSLKQICEELPQNRDELLKVNGVGEIKFEKYGELFLNLCKEVKEEIEQKKSKEPLKKLTKTYLDSYKLLEEGKTIEEVAATRSLAVNTILTHINLLYDYGKISKDKREKLIEPLEVPKTLQVWIKQGLKECNIRELRGYLSLYEQLYMSNLQ